MRSKVELICLFNYLNRVRFNESENYILRYKKKVYYKKIISKYKKKSVFQINFEYFLHIFFLILKKILSQTLIYIQENTFSNTYLISMFQKVFF